MKNTEKIVFYDGNCGFCNRTVNFVLRKSKDDSIRFAALQSPFTKTFFLSQNVTEIDLNTFYFFDNGKLYDRSTAALRLARYLKGGYPALTILRVIPKFIRDAAYRLVAKYRTKIYRNECIVTSEKEKLRFIS